MKVREVIRLLEKHGWAEMRSRGSHRHFKHPDEAFVITVPGNDGKETRAGHAKRYTQKGRAEMIAKGEKEPLGPPG